MINYYIIGINILAIITTIYDKWASIHLRKKRVRESSLLLIALAGGAVSMFLIMLIIRHKTKHMKFMIGLPIIILIQVYLLMMGGVIQK